MSSPHDDEHRNEGEHHDGGEHDNPQDTPVEADGGAVEPSDTGTLDLDNLDERLPWLESDDDYDGPVEGEGGRVAGFVLGGLLALGLIVGGIWWISHRKAPDVEADGGVIEAPAVAYKEAPKNPGGKTFDGTGDSSFAVSEGQSRPARLGQEAPKPAAPATPAPVENAATANPQGGIGVQVGAYSNKASAEAGWAKLQQAHDALSGVAHRVVEGKADIGTVYRLQAVAGDVAAANALCGRLKSGGVACQVKR